MPDDLHHRDFVAWSEAQAERLRRLAAGERVNDLDWANLIEEVEGLGRSELHAVESLLLQAIAHAMKVAAWSHEQAVGHCESEIVSLLVQARRRFAPSMARLVDLPSIHRDALRVARKARLEGVPLPLVEQPPLGLAELLDEALDPGMLIARLRAE